MDFQMLLMIFIVLGLGILLIIYLHGIESKLEDMSRRAEEINSVINRLIQDIRKKGINFFK